MNEEEEPITVRGSIAGEPLLWTTLIFATLFLAPIVLVVNGKDLGAVAPDDIHIARWKTVTMAPGDNHIKSGQR